MVKRIFIILFVSVLFLSKSGKTQGFAAFVNFRENFIVFDHGNFTQLEHLPIQSFKVGMWGIAYQKSNGTLMVYTNGQEIKLTDIVRNYILTESLLVYHYNNNLFVFDGVEKHHLSMDASYFKADKDVVAFYDRIDKMFKLFYKGRIYDIENALSNEPVNDYQVGDNILAYQDPNQYLNVFFDGNKEQLMLIQGRPSYKVDKNLVAYFDQNLSSFNVYHKGRKEQLAYFKPFSYEVGDDRVAFIDDKGDFRIYENGTTRTITTVTPEMYHVEDSLIVFEEQGYLKCYYNQQIYTIENFIPERMKLHYNTLAYIDQQNHFNVFSKGKKRTISIEPVNFFEVKWGVVWYQVGVNTNKVFFNGKIYD